MSLVGNTLTATIGDEGFHTFAFKQDGEVVITELGEDEPFEAYFEQDGQNVLILGGGGLKLKGSYDVKTLKLTEY